MDDESLEATQNVTEDVNQDAAQNATPNDEAMAALPRWGFAFPGRLRDDLTALALAGTKTTTAGLLAEYEADGETPAKAGDFAVLMDSDEQPIALIETISCRVTRLADVDDSTPATRARATRTPPSSAPSTSASGTATSTACASARAIRASRSATTRQWS